MISVAGGGDGGGEGGTTPVAVEPEQPMVSQTVAITLPQRDLHTSCVRVLLRHVSPLGFDHELELVRLEQRIVAELERE